MEEVPRRTSLIPLAFPCFVLCLIGEETEELLDYQTGIISIVRWSLCPVIVGVELRTLERVSRGLAAPGSNAVPETQWQGQAGSNAPPCILKHKTPPCTCTKLNITFGAHARTFA